MPDFAGLNPDDFYKPIIPHPREGETDQGDPYMLTSPDPTRTAYRYYLYHTDGSHSGDRIVAYGSHDLRNFERIGKVLLARHIAMSEHWAPCVAYCDRTKQYNMFYSRSTPDQPNADIGQKLRRAVADSPEGPFIDQGEFPLELSSDFAIDADVYQRRDFLTGDTKTFMSYVVEFWDHERVGVGIEEVELSQDFSHPESSPKVLVKPSTDAQMYERNRTMPWHVGKRDWEAGETVDWHCIEAPIGGLRSPGGVNHVAYSCGSYKDHTYAVSAIRQEPDSSFTDLAARDHFILKSGTLPGIESAGHPSLVTPNLLVCHGRFTPGGPRQAFYAPLLWDAQDRPYCPDKL